MAIGSIKLAGVAVGAGAALLGIVIVPTLGSALKIVAKDLIKGSLRPYQGGFLPRLLKISDCGHNKYHLCSAKREDRQKIQTR